MLQFFLDLAGELIQFLLRQAKGGGVVAENALCGLLDASFEFVQTIARLLLIGASLIDKIPIHQGLSGGERVGEVGLTCLADGVVELL